MKNHLAVLAAGLLISVGVLLVAPLAVHAGTTCGGVEVAILSCDDPNQGGNSGGGGDPLGDSGVWKLLTMALNIMIGLVGIAAVGGIVYGAIMFASAQDNASQVKEAISTIRNVVIGLAMFILMWAGLQYLIPGGLF